MAWEIMDHVTIKLHIINQSSKNILDHIRVSHGTISIVNLDIFIVIIMEKRNNPIKSRGIMNSQKFYLFSWWIVRIFEIQTELL